jgi:hypothetical protein
MQPRRSVFRRAGGFRLNRLEWQSMRSQSAELRLHPSSSCDAVRRFGVRIEPSAHLPGWRITFRIDGKMGGLRLPLPGIARRSDGLWQHTCFEAFFQADASDNYYEFNFAPSGDWAAYRFSGRRTGRSSPGMPAPSVSFQCTADDCELIADIPVAALPELAGASVVRAGLSAIIESEDGSLSWWAISHAGDKPDFHDPSTFAIRVMPP